MYLGSEGVTRLVVCAVCSELGWRYEVGSANVLDGDTRVGMCWALGRSGHAQGGGGRDDACSPLSHIMC
jgi:hypothetical protein